MVGVMGLLIGAMGLLILPFRETGFEVMESDLPTSSNPCYIFNNGFSICGNIFKIVETLTF